MRRLGIACAVVVAAVLAGAASAAGSGWSIETTQNPGTENNHLYGVSCPSVTRCVAVGNYGPGDNGRLYDALAERWNGAKWSLQQIPNPSGDYNNQLNGVSCAKASACTAVGSYQLTAGGYAVPLAERWNGTGWTIQHPPTPTGGLYAEPDAVSCSSASACTAVGHYGKSNGRTLTLAERWNGRKWSIETTPNPKASTYSTLKGVSCTSASACMAVGYSGFANKALAERWNGSKWSITATPKPSGAAQSHLYAVSCASAKECAAVGDYSTNSAGPLPLVESWNGTKWSLGHAPKPTGAKQTYLYGVSCSTWANCIAVGEDVVSIGYFPFAERWNGTKWSLQHPKTPADADTSVDGSQLKGVSCASASACTAAGYYPTTPTEQLTLAEGWSG